jgi:hypothetical protein
MLRYTEVLRLLLLICLKVVECFIFLLLMINKTSSHEMNYYVFYNFGKKLAINKI